MKAAQFKEYQACLEKSEQSYKHCVYKENVALYFRAELSSEQEDKVEDHKGACPICAEDFAQETKRVEELGDVLDEFHYRLIGGEEPSIKEYVGMYAHLGDDLVEHLGSIKWMVERMDSVEFPPLPDGIMESARTTEI